MEGCLRTTVLLSQQHSPLSATAAVGLYLKNCKNGFEVYGMLVELGVQFYSLYMRYFALVSVMPPFTHPNFLIYTVSQTDLPARNKFIQTPVPG